MTVSSGAHPRSSATRTRQRPIRKFERHAPDGASLSTKFKIERRRPLTRTRRRGAGGDPDGIGRARARRTSGVTGRSWRRCRNVAGECGGMGRRPGGRVAPHERGASALAPISPCRSAGKRSMLPVATHLSINAPRPLVMRLCRARFETNCRGYEGP